MTEKKKKSTWKVLLAGCVLTLIVLSVMHYHVIVSFGDYKQFIICPKDYLSFRYTWINITDWKIQDYLKHRHILKKLGFTYFNYLISDKKQVDGNVSVTSLEKKNFYCISGENGLYCIKF